MHKWNMRIMHISFNNKVHYLTASFAEHAELKRRSWTQFARANGMTDHTYTPASQYSVMNVESQSIVCHRFCIPNVCMYQGSHFSGLTKFHDFSRFFRKFPGIFSLFLKYNFQAVLNINMHTSWVSYEQKINPFNYTPN